MHLLGHSFSQKRGGCKRPRDLHIRKVSFSGSSASGCSLSSSDSTLSACTAFTPPQHADHAPPRLHDRPLKAKKPCRIYLDSMTFDDTMEFYDDDIDADDDDDVYSVAISDGEESEGDDGLSIRHFDMEMPPNPQETHHHHHHNGQEDQQEEEEEVDYFALQLSRRPPMPRSRWSESTIQSVQSLSHVPTTPGSSVSTAATEQDLEDLEDLSPVVTETPLSFSHGKRAISTPNPATPDMPGVRSGRPPLRTMDSVEDFVKRGGWKRRGIVFQQADVAAKDSVLA